MIQTVNVKYGRGVFPFRLIPIRQRLGLRLRLELGLGLGIGIRRSGIRRNGAEPLPDDCATLTSFLEKIRLLGLINIVPNGESSQ